MTAQTHSTTAPLVLVAATEAHIEDIAALWHRGWQDGHAGCVPAELLEHRDLASFERRVPPRLPITVAAISDSRLAGFLMTHDDEIEQLYVDASVRGTGIADSLLRHGETVISRRFTTAWLAVVPGNARARRFYERNGWIDAGAFDYPAEAGRGSTISVPARRYEKHLAALSNDHSMGGKGAGR